MHLIFFFSPLPPFPSVPSIPSMSSENLLMSSAVVLDVLDESPSLNSSASNPRPPECHFLEQEEKNLVILDNYTLFSAIMPFSILHLSPGMTIMIKGSKETIHMPKFNSQGCFQCDITNTLHCYDS